MTLEIANTPIDQPKVLAGDKVETLKLGIETARKAILDGRAIRKLEELTNLSQSLG